MREIRAFLILFLFVVPCYAENTTMEDGFYATARITKRETPTAESGCGTGVVWKETKDYFWILTAAHIVEETGPVEVEFFYTGKQSHVMKGEATHVNWNKRIYRLDLALIRLPKTELKDYPPPNPIPLGDRDRMIRINETIISVGCANAAWPTAFIGHVSGVDGTSIFKFLPCPLGGRSGSAIFDSGCNEIIGIIVRGDEKNGTGGRAIGLKQIYTEFDEWTKPQQESLEINPSE